MAFGPIIGRLPKRVTVHGCRWIIARRLRAYPAAAARQPSPAGTSTSAMTRSSASSSSSSLFATCQYTEVAPEFSRVPRRRMLSPSSPSASSRPSAASTIWSRLSAGCSRRARAGRVQTDAGAFSAIACSLAVVPRPRLVQSTGT
nr:hypothetical protein [Actinomadura madurae]